ncbi:alpha/beta hydrolase, partial [Rhodocytophaga aerolata]
MKKYLIFLVLLIIINHQSYAQASAPMSKYGSNRDNGKYIAIDKIKVYYETYGQGTPLLLLHGGLGSIVNFEK